MSYTASQLLVLSTKFEKVASESLVKTAKGKDAKKGKLPPWLKKRTKDTTKDSDKDTNSAKDKKTDSKSKSVKDSKKKKTSSVIEVYDRLIAKYGKEAKPPTVGIPRDPNAPMELDDDGNELPEGVRPTLSFQKNRRVAPIPFRQDVQNAQRRLNSLRQTGRVNLPTVLDPDGKLGNLTRAALKAYKESIGVPHLTDNEAISALGKAPEAAPTVQQPGVYNSLGF